MLDLKKIKKSVACQTGEEAQLFVYLSNSKHASLKYSSSYKDVVLALNINSTKSFIITKSMWKILRPHLSKNSQNKIIYLVFFFHSPCNYTTLWSNSIGKNNSLDKDFALQRQRPGAPAPPPNSLLLLNVAKGI